MLSQKLSFWEFFALMASGDTRVGFLPFLAANRPITQRDLHMPSNFLLDFYGPSVAEFNNLVTLVKFSEADH